MIDFIKSRFFITILIIITIAMFSLLIIDVLSLSCSSLSIEIVKDVVYTIKGDKVVVLENISRFVFIWNNSVVLENLSLVDTICCPGGRCGSECMYIANAYAVKPGSLFIARGNGSIRIVYANFRSRCTSLITNGNPTILFIPSIAILFITIVMSVLVFSRKS